MTSPTLFRKKRTARIRPVSDPDPDPLPPPSDSRRSLRPRRRRPLAGDFFDDDYDVAVDDDDEDETRRKLRLLLNPPSPRSNGEDEPMKKQRIVSGTRLPEKSVLIGVLEKLQKKDTYGVFAHPVEKEELPDYYDVIEHPMDFGTVRRKLADGVYESFEQFEDDVFLICSNAMQYNAPDTIYFRQAHSIQEMARKKFQQLQADGISSGAVKKTEEDTSFHTLEKKTPKKPQYRNASDLLRHDMCYLENIIKNPQGRTTLNQHVSEFPITNKKILKRPQRRTKPMPIGSHSLNKKSLGAVNDKPVSKNHPSSFSFTEKKNLKEPFKKNICKPFDPDVSSLKEKMLKVPQSTLTPPTPDSDVSEDKTSNEAQYRTVTKPSASDVSSENKRSSCFPCASEPLQSHSSGAIPASSADTCTNTSRLQIHGLASSAEACTRISASQGNGLLSATEPQTRLALLRINAVEKPFAPDESVDGSSSPGDSKSDKGYAVPGKSSPSEVEMASFVVDVNRRETYNTQYQDQSVDPDSVFDVFEDEPRELLPVELQAQYQYARSLAMFAASLGPIAWEIASNRIEQALPPGVKFGRGWVGEYESLPTPVIYVASNMQQQQHHIQEQQQQQRYQIQEQQQWQQRKHIQQPQTKQDKWKEMKSKPAENDLQKNMPFYLQSQVSTIRYLNMTSNGPEGTNQNTTQDHKQGIFGINHAYQPAISSSMSPHQNQATRSSLDVHINCLTAHEPQSSSEVAPSKFQPLIQRQKNQVHVQPQQQLLALPPQNLNTWRSCESNHPNSSGIISSQQAGPNYWSARGSQEQATKDPLRWMSPSGKNINQPYSMQVSNNNNLERSVPNTTHSPRQDSPNNTTAQPWMLTTAKWKPIDSVGIHTKKLESSSFNPASRNPQDSTKMQPEPFQGYLGASQARHQGLVMFPQLMTMDVSRLRPPWQGLVHHNKQKDQLPPDLNISFQPPESPALPSSGILIDSQQPDLALQL